MRRVVLHLGMPKTGSTSIQGYLRAQQNFGAFRYLGRSVAGNFVVGAFVSDAVSGRHRKRGVSPEAASDESAGLRAKFVQEMRAAGPREVGIFSSEILPTLGDEDLARFLDCVREFAADVVAVAYVRPPIDFAESALQQAVKSGKANFALPVPDYRARFERFERLLGADNVRYWQFDPAGFPGGCVVRDFCYRLGVPMPSDFVASRNVGLSLPAIRLLYIYRRIGAGIGVGDQAVEENRNLIDVLSQLDGTKLRFHEELVAKLLEANAQDIAWMEERAGSWLREYPARPGETVRDEEDLLRASPESAAWLAARLGRAYSGFGASWANLEDVSSMVHALRAQG